MVSAAGYLGDRMPEVERADEEGFRRLEADSERGRLLRSQPKEGRQDTTTAMNGESFR